MQSFNTAVFAVGICLAHSSAFAADTVLGGFGRTQLQMDTGDAVQRTCGGFVASEADPNIPLFRTCRAMVHTSNALIPGSQGPTRDSLGIGADELANSLQQIATEEFAATETMATDMSQSRMDPVLGRIVELRDGARGFSVAGLLPAGQLEAFGDNNRSALGRSAGGSAGEGHSESRLGGFVNTNYGTGDRNGSDKTDGFDFDSLNIMLGVDYRIEDHFVVGFALSYFELDSDFDQNDLVSGGDINADGFGTTAYATWYRENFYLDVVAGYSASDYDLNRSIIIPSNNPAIASINENARAETESDDYSFSIGTGYDFISNALSWGPYFRATYLKVDIDGYQENGADQSGLNLKVEDQEWESLTSALGVQVNFAISQDFGVIVPHGRLGWIHQFEADNSIINAVYIDDPGGNILSARTDGPEEDYAELGVGISAIFKGGMQAFINYDTVLGIDNLDIHIFTAGLRWEL